MVGILGVGVAFTVSLGLNVAFVKYNMELYPCQSVKVSEVTRSTHMSDQRLDKFVSVAHIGQDHGEVLLRSS